jgi:hypothetical protein
MDEIVRKRQLNSKKGYQNLVADYEVIEESTELHRKLYDI